MLPPWRFQLSPLLLGKLLAIGEFPVALCPCLQECRGLDATQLAALLIHPFADKSAIVDASRRSVTADPLWHIRWTIGIIAVPLLLLLGI